MSPSSSVISTCILLQNGDGNPGIVRQFHSKTSCYGLINGYDVARLWKVLVFSYFDSVVLVRIICFGFFLSVAYLTICHRI